MKSLTRQGATQATLFAAVLFLAFLQIGAQDAAQGARKVLLKTAPIYPTLARSMNIHGTVKIEALVGPNGVVKSVDVKGGHPLLTQSAVTAVGHWKFEPAPKESKELIEIKFDE